MPLTIAIIILTLSFILSKYFQYKSLRYFKEKYDLIKQNFLFYHVFYPPNKYYVDIKGIKLRNKAAVIFTVGLVLAVLCFIVLSFLLKINAY